MFQFFQDALDFNNQAEDIQNAFQPYYERTILDGETDPNAVYELRRRLIDLDLYSQEDAHQFCLILFNKKAGHEQLASFLDPLVRKFTSELEGEERVELRKVMRKFVNGYAFLARIIPFSDQNLEEYYQFSRHNIISRHEHVSIGSCGEMWVLMCVSREGSRWRTTLHNPRERDFVCPSHNRVLVIN